MWKKPNISGLSFHSWSLNQIKRVTASNGNRTQVDCLEGSYAHHYTTGMVNQLLYEIRFQSHYLPDPTNDPLVVLVSFVMNFLCSPIPHSLVDLVRYMAQEKWKSNKRCNNSLQNVFRLCKLFREHFTQLFREQFTQELHTSVVNFLYQ